MFIPLEDLVHIIIVIAAARTPTPVIDIMAKIQKWTGASRAIKTKMKGKLHDNK